MLIGSGNKPFSSKMVVFIQQMESLYSQRYTMNVKGCVHLFIYIFLLLWQWTTTLTWASMFYSDILQSSLTEWNSEKKNIRTLISWNIKRPCKLSELVSESFRDSGLMTENICSHMHSYSTFKVISFFLFSLEIWNCSYYIVCGMNMQSFTNLLKICVHISFFWHLRVFQTSLFWNYTLCYTILLP